MKKFLLSVALVGSFIAGSAVAAEQIRIVGSSTVYPFVTAAAEQFGKGGKFKTPVVESTGTGGGFKLFCSGAGDDTPDFANASRAIKDSEKEDCAKNGVKNIEEIKIGYDGIVLASAKTDSKLALSKADIFKALAKKVAKDGALIENPYKTWNEINAQLPKTAIAVYGPPPTSGTRDSFVEMVMVKACKDQPEFKAAFADEKDREKACGLVREDGAYIEAGENDNLIVQKLQANKDALGIFGYSYLDSNKGKLVAEEVDGVKPTLDSIASGKYTISRPLYVYAKMEHAAKVPGMKEFIRELISDKAIGEYGYLTAKGLIPLSKDEYAKISKKLQASIK